MEFARRYGPAIYQWCRRWGVQDADAEDVTQAVLLQLVEQMRSFDYDPTGSFRAWLKTIAYRAWRKILDKRLRCPQQADEQAQEALASVEASEDLVTRLQREYDRERLDLAMLNVAHRVESHTWEAFRLTALEGRSGADAAQQLNMRIATVYVARSKVVKMLRDEILLLDAHKQ